MHTRYTCIHVHVHRCMYMYMGVYTCFHLYYFLLLSPISLFLRRLAYWLLFTLAMLHMSKVHLLYTCTCMCMYMYMYTHMYMYTRSQNTTFRLRCTVKQRVRMVLNGNLNGNLNSTKTSARERHGAANSTTARRDLHVHVAAPVHRPTLHSPALNLSPPTESLVSEPHSASPRRDHLLPSAARQIQPLNMVTTCT